MKRIILVLALMLIMAPAQAYNQYGSQSNTSSQPSSSTTKVYNQYGSLQGYTVLQPSGRIKTYDKNRSYTGYYKQDGSKLKYYKR